MLDFQKYHMTFFLFNIKKSLNHILFEACYEKLICKIKIILQTILVMYSSMSANDIKVRISEIEEQFDMFDSEMKFVQRKLKSLKTNKTLMMHSNDTVDSLSTKLKEIGECCELLVQERLILQKLSTKKFPVAETVKKSDELPVESTPNSKSSCSTGFGYIPKPVRPSTRGLGCTTTPSTYPKPSTKGFGYVPKPSRPSSKGCTTTSSTKGFTTTPSAKGFGCTTASPPSRPPTPSPTENVARKLSFSEATQPSISSNEFSNIVKCIVLIRSRLNANTGPDYFNIIFVSFAENISDIAENDCSHINKVDLDLLIDTCESIQEQYPYQNVSLFKDIMSNLNKIKSKIA